MNFSLLNMTINVIFGFFFGFVGSSIVENHTEKNPYLFDLFRAKLRTLSRPPIRLSNGDLFGLTPHTVAILQLFDE